MFTTLQQVFLLLSCLSGSQLVLKVLSKNKKHRLLILDLNAENSISEQ